MIIDTKFVKYAWTISGLRVTELANGPVPYYRSIEVDRAVEALEQRLVTVECERDDARLELVKLRGRIEGRHQ